MIETQYFRISPGRYVRQALTLWLSRWWWTVLTPLAALIVAGSVDARYYIVALALLLVVYPGLMMLIYFNYALRPEAAWSTISHKLIFNDNGFEIIYEKGDDDRPVPKPRRMNDSQVSSIEDCGTSLLLHLKSGRYDFIEIPTTALKSDETRALLQKWEGIEAK